MAYLQKNGYSAAITESGEQTVDACTYDSALPSSPMRSNQFTAESDRVGRLYRSAIPLPTWENDLLDGLRFTRPLRDQYFGELEAGHYASMIKGRHPRS
ncbi:hypothetical protein [Stenotrophomonas sp. NRRL B-14846]|uniref:hypothetical protein n=1 Tax=Stenotrophomonas sp. NRRL B-14846 TaxID=3162882 RepID=UPI003D2D846B